MRRSMRALPMRSCRPALPILAPRRLPVPPQTSDGISPPKPRSGARWSGRPASGPTDGRGFDQSPVTEGTTRPQSVIRWRYVDPLTAAEGGYDDDSSRRQGTHASRPGNGNGRADAAVLDSRRAVIRARARRGADPADAAWREADRVSRQRRQGRRDGPSLPASLRLAVPRTQRGRRDPLHLSWLEIRCRRQLHRHGERAAEPGFQAQGEGQGLPGGRARRGGVGPYGIERQGADTAGI